MCNKKELPKLRVTSSSLACRSLENQAVTNKVAAYFFMYAE